MLLVWGMDYSDIERHFGSATEAAKAAKLTRQAVSYWKAAGVPAPRQLQFKNLTKGKLMVSKEAEAELRELGLIA